MWPSSLTIFQPFRDRQGFVQSMEELFRFVLLIEMDSPLLNRGQSVKQML
jgi:hypothetical protein